MLRGIDRAVEVLCSSSCVVALTGAGISTPSGIPDFRSARSGLWNRQNPLDIASLWAFHEDPERFYRWFRPLLQKAQAARPNRSHYVLAEMERAGRLQAVITQNIDSLHQRAGNRQVYELHGHGRTVTCIDCGEHRSAAELISQILHGGSPPRCPACGGPVKPDIVLFGEPLPYEALSQAQALALQCDAMLVVGTSLEVMPASDLPLLAKRRGAKTILVNLSPTPLDEEFDVVVRADVVRALHTIWRGWQRTIRKPEQRPTLRFAR